MKLKTLIICLLVVIKSNSQDFINETLQYHAMNALLDYGQYPRKTVAVNSVDLIDTLESYIKIKPVESKQAKLIFYKNATIDLLNSFHATFLYDDKNRFPIFYEKNKDGSLMLVIHEVLNDNNFNSFKLSAKERAALVIKESVFDKLDDLNKIKIEGLKSICVGVVYGYKSFLSDDKYEKSKSEYVAVILPIQALKQFRLAKITDQQFINLCQVLQTTETNTLQRINVTFK